jgi:hypothetical protein
MKVVAASGIAPDSLGFSEALIYLSYTAVVPPRGIAPRSLAYRARALLLSYGGMKNGRPTR